MHWKMKGTGKRRVITEEQKDTVKTTRWCWYRFSRRSYPPMLGMFLTCFANDARDG